MTHPVLSLIESIAQTRAAVQADARWAARLYILQRWQVERLLKTYSDFHALPRYVNAIEFFVHDLYGPHDYRDRDRDLQRVLEPWQHILPRRALQAVMAALQLEALTQELDLAVLHALNEKSVDTHSYAQAYRATNRRDDRERQIALIVECGKALDALIANPWVRRALRLAKLPARVAGVNTLHEFLERGYEAFAKMDGASELLQAIELRETENMNNLFAGRIDPRPHSQQHAAVSSA
jgi:hypothetical protein